MIIYKTTNLINSNIYVGFHNTSAEDGYLGSGTILLNAVNRYGKENFKRETLEFVNENNWQEREIYWIAQLSATKKYGNYNITNGGFGGDTLSNHPDIDNIKKKMSKANKGKTVSEETKLKISQAQLGEKNHMYGKTGEKHPLFGISFSEETKLKMSQAQLGEKSSWYGKHHTMETKQKISKSNKGKSISLETRKKISESKKGKLCSLETKQKLSKKIKINNTLYNSLTSASNILNIKIGNIHHRLKSKNYPNYIYVNKENEI